MQWSNFRRSLAALALTAAFVYAGLAIAPGADGAALAQQVPSLAPQGGMTGTPMPTANNLSNTLGGASDSDIWRQIRNGIQGQVSILDPIAGVMVQSEGDNWRAIRNGPLATYGWWALAGTCALLALFFAFRGRIRIEAGPSGKTIQRFKLFERFVHWLTAGSFIVLAITGLNVIYGRYFFATTPAGDAGDFSAMHKAFATITYLGKFAHNYLGFAFFLGIVLMFAIWVRHNIPNKYDLEWLAKGGGMFSRGVHPPSRKFNAGQKVLFWLVIGSGVALFVTGLSLMFPFSWFGMQEMQLINLIHSGVALAIVAVIIAHIYIGSVGMEGAFDAMGTGDVDENWAREHHNIWVAEQTGEPLPGDGPPTQQPAE